MKLGAGRHAECPPNARTGVTDLCYFFVTLCKVCTVCTLPASKPPLFRRNRGPFFLWDQEVAGSNPVAPAKKGSFQIRKRLLPRFCRNSVTLKSAFHTRKALFFSPSLWSTSSKNTSPIPTGTPRQLILRLSPRNPIGNSG
jgi:hypothetical protein